MVLGRVAPAEFLPENMKLDVDAARSAIREKVAEPLSLDLWHAATGILDIVNVKMAMAVRTVTVQRGLDPKDFALFAFGGAGPMHACFVARELGIGKVVVPIAPGQFSAFGILGSDIRHDLVRTAPAGTDALQRAFIKEQFDALESDARAVLAKEGVAETDFMLLRSVDIRYVGQEYTVNVPIPEEPIDEDSVLRARSDFHEFHEQTYSHSKPDDAIELVNLRVAAIGRRPKIELPKVAAGKKDPPPSARVGSTEICFDAAQGFTEAAVWDRRELLAGNQIDGPAIIADPGATTVVPPRLPMHGELPRQPGYRRIRSVDMSNKRIDPITLEVIRHASIAAAEEMKTNLMRTAHNPIIYEVLDFSCGVFDHRGNMIAQADGLPIFLGNLAAAIRVVIDDIGLENFRPGDLYLINDPYATGTHVNDLTTVNPVFDDEGEIIAFTSARAHWLDIGAKDPGGSIDSTDIVQEGLWLRSVQLYDEGELNESMWRVIQYNVRYTRSMLGDLQAQVAASRTGEKRIQEIFRRHGRATVRAAIDELFKQGEQRARASIPCYEGWHLRSRIPTR